MDAKERRWHLKRVGKFTASEVHNIMTASGKWTQTAISYLYKLQRERTLNQPSKCVHSRPLEWGNEEEPYAIEWLRNKWKDYKIFHCDADGEDKIFIDGFEGFGGSPDAYLIEPTQNKVVAYVEVKSPASEGELAYVFSPSLPYEKKRSYVFKEHGWQLVAQMALPDAPDVIYLLKYDGQDDDDEFDMRSPLDDSRGVIFKFTRQELQPLIEQMKERVKFAHEYLNSNQDLDDIQSAWDKFKEKK